MGGRPVVLDLCGGTGSWGQPYRDAGYEVLTVDPFAEPEDGIREDVRTWRVPEGLRVRGVIAAPPCTIFAVSGARWWAERDPDGERLRDGLSVVDACLRIVATVRPEWWVLENPVGRLRHWLGAPAATFQPWEYGDGYSKRTLLWGSFSMPPRVHATPPKGTDDRIHRAPPGPGRARFRSMTPPMFARAFMEANP